MGNCISADVNYTINTSSSDLSVPPDAIKHVVFDDTKLSDRNALSFTAKLPTHPRLESVRMHDLGARHQSTIQETVNILAEAAGLKSLSFCNGVFKT